MQQYFVYILKCYDGLFYVGHTDNIEGRISAHNNKTYGGFTAKRLPVEVVYVEKFDSRDDAFHAERQIKGWSRAKKKALIESDWKKIVLLSNQ